MPSINYCAENKNRFTVPFYASTAKWGDLLRIMGKIKSEILNLADWSKRHLEKLIILIGVLIMTFILFVLLSWSIGYYANGFFGFKFELGSIWQGLGACVAAITGLITMAGTSLAKLYVNSRYNSPQGEKPNDNKSGRDEHETSHVG